MVDGKRILQIIALIEKWIYLFGPPDGKIKLDSFNYTAFFNPARGRTRSFLQQVLQRQQEISPESDGNAQINVGEAWKCIPLSELLIIYSDGLRVFCCISDHKVINVTNSSKGGKLLLPEDLKFTELVVIFFSIGDL